MSNVKLLPLPDDLHHHHIRMGTSEHHAATQAYARVNVEHHIAAKDAEIEALREDAANSLGALRVAAIALASAAKGSPAYLPAYNHISAAIDQARGKGVQS